MPTEIIEADASERYYIDYGQLQSFWKTTNFAVTNADNGTIQAVNSETSDQTLPIVGAVAQSAIQIAGGVATAGVSIPIARANKQYAQAVDLPTQKLLMAGLYQNSASLKLKIEKNTPEVEKEEEPKYSPGACSGKAFNYWQAVQHQSFILRNKKSTIPRTGASEAAAADPEVTQAANAIVEATKPITATFVLEPEFRLDEFKQDPYIKDGGDLLYSTTVDLIETAGFVAEAGALKNAKVKQEAFVTYNDGSPVPIQTAVNLEFRLKRWTREATTTSAESEEWSVGSGKPATDNHIKNQIQYDGLVVRSPAAGSLRICVGPCDTNAAAGISAIGGAGSAYGAAATARDTAIAAQNTALNAGVTYATGNATLAGDQASYADQVLKSQADCILQQTAIVKSGATPKIDCK